MSGFGAEARATIALRSVHYGTPEQSFATTAALWSAWLEGRHGSEARIDASDVGVMLALLKVGRLAHDPAHHDSALDAAAYLALGQAAAKPRPPRQPRTGRAKAGRGGRA